MRFFALATGLFAALAAAASTPNAFINPIAGASFTAGETSTLKWTPSTSGTVSLRLQWGALTTATEGIAIATAIDNTGSFAWSVPADIPKEADYFIRIASDDDTAEVNYSARFTISGVSGGASSIVASATTSMSSTTLVTSTTATSTSTSSSSSSSSTSTSSSSHTSTPASTTSAKTTATPSPTTPASSPAKSTTTATTTSASPSATTSVPNLNAGESVRVSGWLMGVVGLGAFAML